MAMTPSAGFIISIGAIGVIAGIAAILVYRALQTRPSIAMTSFQLKPRQTKREFVILTAGNFVLTTALIAFLIGAVTADTYFMTLSELGSVIGAGFITVVIGSWWRRMRA